MEKLKNWMIDSANILFDDSKNDLRSLPRSVRLQILLVLSFIWTTVFSQSASVFKAKNYDPFKIMIIVFVIVFIFVFSKGIEVLNKTNSYTIEYDGPDKTAEEKWLPFTQKKKNK